jgi:phospholipase/carboxylesterase
MDELKHAGLSIEEAEKVAIMIHGRGANAASILSLQNNLNLKSYALLAPQAPENTWYPYSFMATDHMNEPSLSRAIGIIDKLVKELFEHGVKAENIFFIGFSQGACLALEYAARNAQKYGAVIAFTGGLIGEELNPQKYFGDFNGAPVFIGANHKDMHVPLARIEATANLMEKLGAKVKTMIFEDTSHSIRQEELDWVNENIL